MEAAMGGASSIDGDWESICRMLSIDQEPDFTNLLGNTCNYDQLPADHNQGVISLLMAGDASPIPSLHELGGTPSYFNVDRHSLLTPTWNNNHSQLSCSSDDHLSSFSSSIGFHADQDDFLMNEVNAHTDKDPMENADELKMQHEVPLPPKKRVRVSKDALKGKRKARAKKSKHGGVHEEEEKSSKCYVLDDESNDSQEERKTPKSDIGKKRTGRGEATDPQSLYARRRRERINERLKILQTLVPNGTKVDISTMLEEAVHYVKFLQMQIKLLSSEELWMYAPLAYNGFDVGHYNNFSPY